MILVGNRKVVWEPGAKSLPATRLESSGLVGDWILDGLQE
jgi:hypothetical protein